MNLALKNGVDISSAMPTGPMGRIIERDIERLLEEKTGLSPRLSEIAASEKIEKVEDEAYSAKGYLDDELNDDAVSAKEDEPLNDESKPSTACEPLTEGSHVSGEMREREVLTLTAVIDPTALLSFCDAAASKGERLGLSKISMGEMIVYSFARTLRTDGGFGEDADIKYTFGASGERTAILGSTRGMSLDELSRRIKSGADGLSCRFSVIELSELGISSFTPPLCSGELLSLGIGSINRDSSELVLTLRFDGGAVEFYHAARLFRRLCDELELFGLSLAK